MQAAASFVPVSWLIPAESSRFERALSNFLNNFLTTTAFAKTSGIRFFLFVQLFCYKFLNSEIVIFHYSISV